MSDRLLCEVLHTERQLISAIGALRMAFSFSQPQTWTLPMLRTRWPGLNDEAIAQLARDRVGYAGETRALTLLLDEVIAIDAVIGERMRAQRQSPRLARSA